MDDADLLRRWRMSGVRRGLEPSSLRRREDDLRCLGRWWGRGLLSIPPLEIDRFLDARVWHGRHLSDRSRYKWLSTISTFFAWAVREELVDFDPTSKLERPRLRRLLPRPWSAADAEEAIRQASNGRLRAWLLLVAYGGLRCAEIAHMTREDIIEGADPVMAIVHGKGRKDRVVPLHARVVDALRALPMPRRGPLWLAANGRPFTPAQVSQIINRHFDQLDMPWTAHQGRHWFGSQALEACGDLRVVQELLGHESITSTTIYTQWSKARAAEAVAALPVPAPSAPRLPL